MSANPYASPEHHEEQRTLIVEGPTNPIAAKIVALVFFCFVVPTYGYFSWADKGNRLLPPAYSELEFWVLIAIFFWIAVWGVIAFRERTRVFANSIDSSTIPPRRLGFHEVAYVRQITESPPTIYFIKRDGKEVIVRGGTPELLAAFREIAARYPPPVDAHG